MAANKEHDEYSQNLGDKIESLLTIYEMMPKNMPRGSVIHLEREDGTSVELSKKQLKSKKEELLQEVRKGLPKRLRQAGKRTRKVNPSDFKNVYTPVIVADAVRQLLNTEDFGPMDPTDSSSPKLIDQLPCIQKGYGLRNSFQLLWYICIDVNGLKDEKDKTMLSPSQAMKEAFGAIPAWYTNEVDEDGKIKTSPNEKRLSTFDVLEYRVNALEQKEESFDREKFKIYFFATILSINVFKSADLPQDSRDSLKREDVKAQLLKEFELIKEAKEKWKAINKEQKNS